MNENANNLYKDILEQVDAGTLIIDQNGMILFANLAYSALSGYPVSEVIGKKIDAYIDGLIEMKQNSQGEVFVKCNGKEDIPKFLYINHVEESISKQKYACLVMRDYHTVGYDPLTTLPNRLLLSKHLHRVIKKAKEKRSLFAVLFIDLDRFKFINDTLGHANGDLLLQEAAKRITNAVGAHNVLYRFGGDEFVCIFEDVKDETDTGNVAKSIIDSFSKPIMLNHTEVFITLSIGISIFPYDGDEVETLLTNADSAMYQAKKVGHNQYKRVKVHENAGAFEKLLLENSLRQAIKEDQLTLYFQPQINIKKNKLSALEALIRWDHPELGLISPRDFIPIAEETGLILLIDEWVLKTACRRMKEWQNKGLAPVKVAVNLSAAQFFQNDLVKKVDQILEETGLDATYLELEITESMVMHDVRTAIHVLEQLRERGIHLSLDDFGTGYSSLNYLKELPVDTLKIDRSFIKDMDTNPNSVALTKTIITLAHDLNLYVIAEGVENERQLQLVKEQSCDAVQGYYFSRPLNDEETVRYLNCL